MSRAPISPGTPLAGRSWPIPTEKLQHLEQLSRKGTDFDPESLGETGAVAFTPEWVGAAHDASTLSVHHRNQQNGLSHSIRVIRRKLPR